MVASCLVDTGAILAHLDRQDPWHALCSDALSELPLPLITSMAVVAEVFHLTSKRRVDQSVAWAFLRSGGISVATIGNDDLPHLHSLMSRYADHPMDFADATLVHLAGRESITKIFTIDSDFETYRIAGRRRFTILPVARL
jgi:uncharacterized protein